MNVFHIYLVLMLVMVVLTGVARAQDQPLLSVEIEPAISHVRAQDPVFFKVVVRNSGRKGVLLNQLLSTRYASARFQMRQGEKGRFQTVYPLEGAELSPAHSPLNPPHVPRNGEYVFYETLFRNQEGPIFPREGRYQVRIRIDTGKDHLASLPENYRNQLNMEKWVFPTRKEIFSKPVAIEVDPISGESSSKIASHAEMLSEVVVAGKGLPYPQKGIGGVDRGKLHRIHRMLRDSLLKKTLGLASEIIDARYSPAAETERAYEAALKRAEQSVGPIMRDVVALWIAEEHMISGRWQDLLDILATLPEASPRVQNIKNEALARLEGR